MTSWEDILLLKRPKLRNKDLLTYPLMKNLRLSSLVTFPSEPTRNLLESSSNLADKFKILELLLPKMERAEVSDTLNSPKEVELKRLLPRLVLN